MIEEKKSCIKESVESERVDHPQAWAGFSTVSIWGKSEYYTYGFIEDLQR